MHTLVKAQSVRVSCARWVMLLITTLLGWSGHTVGGGTGSEVWKLEWHHAACNANRVRERLVRATNN